MYKKYIWVSFIVTMLFVSARAHSMEGVFDRRAEIDRYIDAVKNGDRHQAIGVLRQIYASGIADEPLAAATNSRLLRDYPYLKEPNRVRVMPGMVSFVVNYGYEGDGEYGLWLVKALASFGLPQYADTLVLVAKKPNAGGAQSQRIRNTAHQSISLIEWHQHKNELMASRANHNESDDPQTSRLMNLLLSRDSRDRDFAMEVMYSYRIRDARLYAELDRQLQRYIDRLVAEKSVKADKWVVANIKLLGLSGERIHIHTLDEFKASNALPGFKKHAEVALSQLNAQSEGPNEATSGTDNF